MSIINNWKEEIKLINNLGLLYPIINGWREYNKSWNNRTKAWWIYYLCIYQLEQRIPQLEKFTKYYGDDCWWRGYKRHFKIK